VVFADMTFPGIQARIKFAPLTPSSSSATATSSLRHLTMRSSSLATGTKVRTVLVRPETCADSVTQTVKVGSIRKRSTSCWITKFVCRMFCAKEIELNGF